MITLNCNYHNLKIIFVYLWMSGTKAKAWVDFSQWPNCLLQNGQKSVPNIINHLSSFAKFMIHTVYCSFFQTIDTPHWETNEELCCWKVASKRPTFAPLKRSRKTLNECCNIFYTNQKDDNLKSILAGTMLTFWHWQV